MGVIVGINQAFTVLQKRDKLLNKGGTVLGQTFFQLLKDYRFIVGRMNELQKEINELWINRNAFEEQGIKATQLTGMPKGNSTSDPVYDLVQKVFDYYLAEIEAKTNELMELNVQKNKIDTEVKKLSLIEYTIISMRYFYGYDFYQIGKKIHYSKQRAWQLHNEIISKLKN
jgi:DNA-directed RNA polymerase specialized sigma subunit